MKKIKKLINIDLIPIIILSFLFSFSLTYNPRESINWLYFLIIFIIALFIIGLIWKFLLKINLKNPKKINRKEFIVYGILIIIPLVIAILSYYPAYTTYDTGRQWQQVQTSIYDNWHPILETLIFLKLPSLIYNSYISATIFQCLFIFGILMYFCYFLRKHILNFKGTIIILLLMVLNPLFFLYSVTLWKDLPYSWCLFLTTLFLIEIALTDGKWLDKTTHKIFFLLSMIGVLIFRHNGIAPFGLVFILLIIFQSKYRKFLTISFITILLSFSIVTGPIYKMLGFDNKTGGKSEMMGVVMGQISYYYNNDIPFSKKEQKVLNDIVPLKKWHDYYSPTNFNSIKWTMDDFNARLDKNFKKIWKIYLNKSINHPLDFMKSFLNMTNCIWETQSSFSVNYTPKTIDESLKIYSIYRVKENVFNKLVVYNNIVLHSPFRWLFINYGKGLFLIIFSLVLTIRKVKFSFKKWIPYFLVLANTAVIMLLITGGELRFVYSQVLCAVPLVLYSLKLKEK